MSNEIDWAALAEPFPASEIKWLPKIVKKKNGGIYERNGVQVAGCMAHIDARNVMERLDSVAGPDGWSDSTTLTTAGNNVMAICHLTIGGVTKSDTGPTMNANDENAAKEAVSGALKRAAVKFGVGRHLYDLEVQWLPFDGYKITEKPNRLPGQKPATVIPTPPKRNKTREAIEAGKAPDFANMTFAKFVAYCVDTIDRYDNPHGVTGALKVLSFEAWPGAKSDGYVAQREAMYTDLKAYASYRSAGMDQERALKALADELMGEKAQS